MKLEMILLKALDVKESIYMQLDKFDGGPHGNGNNRRSDIMVDVMLSEIARDISYHVMDKKISTRLFSAGRKMMGSSISGLMEAYDAGDIICPPYRHPGWGHFDEPQPSSWFSQRYDEIDLNPQPFPPRSSENLFANFGFFSKEVLIAEILRTMASLTTSKEFNGEIKSVALQLMKSAASGRAYEEFDNRCGSTGPRKPFVPGRVIASEQ